MALKALDTSDRRSILPRDITGVVIQAVQVHVCSTIFIFDPSLQLGGRQVVMRLYGSRNASDPSRPNVSLQLDRPVVA